MKKAKVYLKTVKDVKRNGTIGEFILCIVTLILCVIFGIGLIFGNWCLSGLIIMLLWNWILHGVFGLMALTFWQSVGVSLILSIIGGVFRATVSVKKD